MKENSDIELEIFQPFERMVTVKILGERYEVPENNSVLRCLQYLDMENISNAELCWNGECLNCQAVVNLNGKRRTVMACREIVAEGIEVVDLNAALSFKAERVRRAGE